MKDTMLGLLSSRKFWVGLLSIVGVFAATLLVALKLIPESALVPTISSITATGLTVIGAISWESTSTDKITVASINAGAKVPSNDTPAVQQPTP